MSQAPPVPATNCSDPTHPASVGPCETCIRDYADRRKNVAMTVAERATELELMLRPGQRYGLRYMKLGQGAKHAQRLRELLEEVDVPGVSFRSPRGWPETQAVIDNLDKILGVMRNARGRHVERTETALAM